MFKVGSETPKDLLDVEAAQDGTDTPIKLETGRPEGVKRSLRARHTQMIAIGGILGSGEWICLHLGAWGL